MRKANSVCSEGEGVMRKANGICSKGKRVMRKANDTWIPAFAGMTTILLRHSREGGNPLTGRTVLRCIGLSSLLGMVQPAHAQDAAAGKVVFDDWCRPCHDIEPRKHPGTAALQVLYKGEKPAALEQRLDLTPDIVSFYVRNGVSIMPFFRKTEIDDTELVDLGAYLSPENLRGMAR